MQNLTKIQRLSCYRFIVQLTLSNHATFSNSVRGAGAVGPKSYTMYTVVLVRRPEVQNVDVEM